MALGGDSSASGEAVCVSRLLMVSGSSAHDSGSSIRRDSSFRGIVVVGGSSGSI